MSKGAVDLGESLAAVVVSRLLSPPLLWMDGPRPPSGIWKWEEEVEKEEEEEVGRPTKALAFQEASFAVSSVVLGGGYK